MSPILKAILPTNMKNTWKNVQVSHFWHCNNILILHFASRFFLGAFPFIQYNTNINTWDTNAKHNQLCMVITMQRKQKEYNCHHLLKHVNWIYNSIHIGLFAIKDLWKIFEFFISMPEILCIVLQLTSVATKRLVNWEPLQHLHMHHKSQF